jgi:hypothetical protein
MSTHSTRIIVASFTVSQMRALRNATALVIANAAELCYREQSLPLLTRAWETLEAAWKAGRPDYGDEYRRAHGPRFEAQDPGKGETSCNKGHGDDR